MNGGLNKSTSFSFGQQRIILSKVDWKTSKICRLNQFKWVSLFWSPSGKKLQCMRMHKSSGNDFYGMEWLCKGLLFGKVGDLLFIAKQRKGTSFLLRSAAVNKIPWLLLVATTLLCCLWSQTKTNDNSDPQLFCKLSFVHKNWLILPKISTNISSCEPQKQPKSLQYQIELDWEARLCGSTVYKWCIAMQSTCLPTTKCKTQPCVMKKSSIISWLVDASLLLGADAVTEEGQNNFLGDNISVILLKTQAKKDNYINLTLHILGIQMSIVRQNLEIIRGNQQ